MLTEAKLNKAQPGDLVKYVFFSVPLGVVLLYIVTCSCPLSIIANRSISSFAKLQRL